MLKKLYSHIYDKKLFTISSSFGTVTLWSLAFPMIFESIMGSLQGTVNTAVLSGYSETAVAAVGATTTIVSVFILICSVISMGSTVVVSNSIGAEDIKKTQELSFVTVLVSTSIYIIAIPILLYYSKALLMLLNLEGVILQEAIIYFRIRAGFFFIYSAQSAILALLKCFGYPKYTFIVGTLTGFINLALNIYVIYFPQLSPVTGVTGVAYACVLSNVIGLLASAFYLKKMKIVLKIPDSIKSGILHTKEILRVGLPSVLSGGSVSIAGLVTTAFVATIGDYALSAKVYYTNILSYAYLFSINVGNANALLVGRRFGAGEYDKISRMNVQLTRITRVVNLCISLAIVIFRVPIVGIFTDSSKIIAISLGVFLVDIIAEQARAISQIYEYALRSCGDVLFSVVILIFSCWICSIGLAYFLAIKCNLGLIGFWIGIAADECVRAIVTYLRYKSGKWKKNIKEIVV